MAFAAITNHFSRKGLCLYLLVLGSLLLAPWGTDWPAIFELDRSDIKAGEYWRFLTGPLVHRNWEQLALNVAGVVVLQQLFGKEFNAVALAWGYAFIAIVIGVCMLAFSSLGSFQGLSAVLHGLVAFGAILAMRRDALLGWGVLMAVGAKVVWEQLQGDAALFSGWAQQLFGLPQAVDAHLYGFSAGVLLGAVMVASVGRPAD